MLHLVKYFQEPISITILDLDYIYISAVNDSNSENRDVGQKL